MWGKGKGMGAGARAASIVPTVAGPGKQAPLRKSDTTIIPSVSSADPLFHMHPSLHTSLIIGRTLPMGIRTLGPIDRCRGGGGGGSGGGRFLS